MTATKKEKTPDNECGGRLVHKSTSTTIGFMGLVQSINVGHWEALN